MNNISRHGDPADRGNADAWYRRPKSPHYYMGDTYTSDIVTEENMTPEEIKAYNDAYDEQMATGDHKDWG